MPSPLQLRRVQDKIAHRDETSRYWEFFATVRPFEMINVWGYPRRTVPGGWSHSMMPIPPIENVELDPPPAQG
mgnify:FL=1